MKANSAARAIASLANTPQAPPAPPAPPAPHASPTPPALPAPPSPPAPPAPTVPVPPFPYLFESVSAKDEFLTPSASVDGSVADNPSPTATTTLTIMFPRFLFQFPPLAFFMMKNRL
ncbi:unnamed protein product [Closterium sp. NIES-54]